MRRFLTVFAALLIAGVIYADSFNKIPAGWKWLSDSEVAFTYDGSFTDADCFSVSTYNWRRKEGVKAPAKFTTFPVQPEGAVNLTYSPDSTKLAYTRDNDLYVLDIATGQQRRLTTDGSQLILNGYASWVYYEEILGRSSRYKAFWWSEDSKRIAFYRFDNTKVPMFPIYSPKGQDGSLNQTRYPKAGEPNPEVRIGMIDLSGAFTKRKWTPKTVWADFDQTEDQYFGIPFWGSDNLSFFVSREPRTQNTLDLYSVSALDGSKKHIYHEESDTWLDWIEGMLFTEEGLYMARSFETGWEQVYFLSYDGNTLRRLTDGTNWRVSLKRVDSNGDVYFSAVRENPATAALYRICVNDQDSKTGYGKLLTLTDPSQNLGSVSFAPDGKHFVASLSNFSTPTKVWLYETRTAHLAWKERRAIQAANGSGVSIPDHYASSCLMVADMKGADFNPKDYSLPQMMVLDTDDSMKMVAYIIYPKDFDPTKKYPVHMGIYGGPNSATVTNRWIQPASNQWWVDNGIIHITVDTRVAGHSGKRGTDLDYLDVISTPVKDCLTWAEYLKSLPYVDAAHIGVEGFSFGGSMTATLLLDHSDVFCCGIAGGGVYDWKLYDSHYTERFMDTPQRNPEGYEKARVINHVKNYPVKASETSSSKIMLRLTHGTGDDNVHFQNTLQLVNELQEQGKGFELMIYPDGMHGYRGAQGSHSSASARSFWEKYLLGK